MDVKTLLTYPCEPSAAPAPVLGTDASLPAALSALSGADAMGVPVQGNGYLTHQQAIAGISTMLPYMPDTSELTAVCEPSHYSASAVAHAVEDANAHLLTLMTYPGADHDLTLYLRTDRTDPSEVARSLERHGYSVTYASGVTYTDATVAGERLAELKRYMDI